MDVETVRMAVAILRTDTSNWQTDTKTIGMDAYRFQTDMQIIRMARRTL